MEDFVKLIQQVGFPIAVSLYLLWRYEQRFKEMTAVLQQISEHLAVIREKDA